MLRSTHPSTRSVGAHAFGTTPWTSSNILWEETYSERALLTTNLLQIVTYPKRIPQGQADLTAHIEGVLAGLLRRGIKLPSPDAVRQYLLRFPDMIDLLAPLGKAAAEHFGQSSQLSLEVYRDPETEDKYLTLYVRQAQYADDILDQIDAVSVLFDDVLATKSGWLLITTDFCTPK